MLLAVVALLGHGPSFAAALRVIVISDLNGSYGSTRYEPAVAAAVQRMVGMRPDLVISTGDMVAGQRRHPTLAQPAIESMWNSFHAVVSEPLQAAGIPLAVTPGNHDASAYEMFALERRIYRDQWQTRRPQLRFIDDARYPFQYAFAVGPALFVSLDVTRIGEVGAEQRRWLDELLAREARRFRHRVVFSHLPVYPFTQGRETEVSADHALEEILRRHGVDVYLSGHHHAFYPGYHGGVRFVSQACLGAGPRALIGHTARSPRAITLLEIPDEGPIAVRALAAPDFKREIERSTLPRRIDSRYGSLVRDDLAAQAQPLQHARPSATQTRPRTQP